MPIRLQKQILKTIVRLQVQSMYDEISHNIVYLFSGQIWATTKRI